MAEPRTVSPAPHFGHDLANVRIHTDTMADSVATGYGADAITTGADIFFRADSSCPRVLAGQFG
jgi:hypothetical protein